MSMRFKANSDSPGSKSLLSGEGQRARPERSQQIMPISKERKNNSNVEGQRARPQKEISANNARDSIVIMIMIIIIIIL